MLAVLIMQASHSKTTLCLVVLIYTIGIKLSIYIQQNWKVRLQETMYKYNDIFYMHLKPDHLSTKQRKFNLKNRSLKDTTTALLKGLQNDLKKNAKLEAKSSHNFIICSLMRLKFAKVVHWNFLNIVNKWQKPKLSSWKWTSGHFNQVAFRTKYALHKCRICVFYE